MTEKTNHELVVNENGEFVPNLPVIVAEDDTFITFKRPDGKFERKLKYHEFSSVVAETRKQKLNLMKLLDNSEEMKNYIGKDIVLEGVIIRPYTSLDEETGGVEYGATTSIITDGFSKVITTSSKTVYVKIKELIDMFGQDLFLEGDLLTIVPIKEKGREHQLTSIKVK